MKSEVYMAAKLTLLRRRGFFWLFIDFSQGPATSTFMMEGWGSTFPQNMDKNPQDFMMSQPGRPQFILIKL